MPTYGFEYIDGGSKPSKTIEAENYDAAWGKVAEFINEKAGRTFVLGSLKAAPVIGKPLGIPERFADEAMQSN